MLARRLLANRMCSHQGFSAGIILITLPGHPRSRGQLWDNAGQGPGRQGCQAARSRPPGVQHMLVCANLSVQVLILGLYRKAVLVSATKPSGHVNEFGHCQLRV